MMSVTVWRGGGGPFRRPRAGKFKKEEKSACVEMWINESGIVPSQHGLQDDQSHHMLAMESVI